MTDEQHEPQQHPDYPHLSNERAPDGDSDGTLHAEAPTQLYDEQTLRFREVRQRAEAAAERAYWDEVERSYWRTNATHNTPNHLVTPQGDPLIELPSGADYPMLSSLPNIKKALAAHGLVVVNDGSISPQRSKRRRDFYA